VSGEKIILIGYSGHGFVVADTAIENNLPLFEYAEKSERINNPFHLHFVGNEISFDFFAKNNNSKFLIGIGDNNIRERIYNLIIENHREIVTLINKSASISKTAIIGDGTFINKNVSVNANSKIGKNVILNTACVVEHDCFIADSVHIASGAVLAGNVTIGERSFIGANSVIKQGVEIGKDVQVGAGTVVLTNLPNGIKVVGNPSRVIK
jgi:sugar O-acyltransferase (sialic acid O-acetyltransferase NeuD family)